MVRRVIRADGVYIERALELVWRFLYDIKDDGARVAGVDDHEVEVGVEGGGCPGSEGGDAF